MHIGQQQNEPSPDLEPAKGLENIWPPLFHNNVEQQMAWHRDRQHAIQRQGVSWAVAPGCEFAAPLVRLDAEGNKIPPLLLTSGAEIVEGRDATFGQLLILERRGVVLRATPEGRRAASCPADARYVVAANQAILSKEGQLLAGAEVRAEWLETPQDLALLVHRGIVVDRHKPAVSQLPADVALREREADLERAKAAVDAAVATLAQMDNAETQQSYLSARLQVDLSEVRVRLARDAAEAAKVADAERQREEMQREIDSLEADISARESETTLHGAEVAAARALAAAWHATHAHEDATYQLRIRRNALFAELHGGEMRQENMPVLRIHQIAKLAELADINPKHLNQIQ